MKGTLFVNLEKCVGCFICLMACSLSQTGTIAPTQPRILLARIRHLVINVPLVCRQCEVPVCTDVCPVEAISRDEATGAIVIDHEICIGCGVCVPECPQGGLSLDAATGHSVKCDLCHGDPECVKACTYGAIEYIPD